jgi:hypothetical protein
VAAGLGFVDLGKPGVAEPAMACSTGADMPISVFEPVTGRAVPATWGVAGAGAGSAGELAGGPGCNPESCGMPNMVRCRGRAAATGRGFPQFWQEIWPGVTWDPQFGQAVMIQEELYQQCPIRPQMPGAIGRGAPKTG